MSRERKITRLPHFDYRSDGAYSVTICAFERRCIFGTVENGMMKRNEFGEVAHHELLLIENRRRGVILDEFIVMPNHVHLILFFVQNQEYETATLLRRQFAQSIKDSLSSVIGGYKSGVTREINKLSSEKMPVWQQRFHEHIIRHEKDLFHQREYIKNNPANWQNDEHNSQR